MRYSEEAGRIDKRYLDEWLRSVDEDLKDNKYDGLDIGKIYGSLNECKTIMDVYKLAVNIYYNSNKGFDSICLDSMDIFTSMLTYYDFMNSVKLSIEKGNVVKGKWGMSNEAFKRLNNSGIDTFIIDIENIDKQVIINNINKMRLLGIDIKHNLDVTGNYCVVVQKEYMLAEISNKIKDIIWSIIVIAGVPGDNLWVYKLSIIPSLLPMMFTNDADISRKGMELNRFNFTAIQMYTTDKTDISNIDNIVIYKYKEGNTYGYKDKEIEIPDTKMRMAAKLLEVPEDLRKDKSECLAALSIDVGLDELINSCFYAIDRYIGGMVV